MLDIEPIKAFNDNYIWCLIDRQRQRAVVVDPGDAAPVKQFLKEQSLSLQGIIITHHHIDHIGGLEQLLRGRSVTVYGPHNPAIKAISHRLSENETVELLGYRFDVLAVPGHTLDHIAFYCEELSALFCGDTLFCGGCGRLFEGTPEMMLSSLNKLSALPDTTRVYCAHEYTQANLHFAEAVENNNADLQKRIRNVQLLRDKAQPSVPSTLAEEKLTNPFLRCAQADVVQSAMKRGCPANSTTAEVFATIRSWKDNF
jgi:hydroxyacylglutathione hydrolase